MSKWNEKTGTVDNRRKLSSLLGKRIVKLEITDRNYLKITVANRTRGPVESFEAPADYVFDTDGNRFEDDIS